MKGIIMMGGYGTRLQPLTLRTPKPLLPIAGKPNVDYLVEKIQAGGIKNVVISANKNNVKVREYLTNEDVEFIIEDTNSDKDKLGVVGAIKYLKSIFGSDDYLILAGDNFFHGLELKDVKDYHNNEKPDATIGLYQLQDKSEVEKFGVAVLDAKNRITSFQEKPKPEEATPSLEQLTPEPEKPTPKAAKKKYPPGCVRSRQKPTKEDNFRDLHPKD